MVQLRQRPQALAHRASRLEKQQHQRRAMRRPAEARSSEAASATLCSQGRPAEGKGKSAQVSAWAHRPHPHYLKRDKYGLDGRRAGGNQKPLPSRAASCPTGPWPAGGLLSAAISRGPADSRTGATVRGLEASSSVLPTWLGTREGPAVEITEPTQTCPFYGMIISH